MDFQTQMVTFHMAWKKNPNKNITRIEIKNEKGESSRGGWQVRFHRRGKKIGKFFSDRKYGSKSKALTEAKRFRDETQAQLPQYSVNELAKNVTKRNTSGHVGVRPHEHVAVRGGWHYTYYFWIAQWTEENGTRRTKSFSVDHYGEEAAFELAIQARKKGMAKRK